MMLGKLSRLLSGCGLSWLLLLALPAQAQTNTVHQMGVLGASDEQFSTGSYFDSYKIEGSEGQRVSISLDSSDFDTFLGLLDSDGNLVASNNNAAADNLNSFISTTLPRNDTYTVFATSSVSQSGGDYRMALRNFSPPPVSRTRNNGNQDSSSTLVASPLGQMLMLGFAGALLDSMFSGGGSSSAPDYELIRTGNSYPSTSQTAPQPVTPIGGNRGFYGSDHTP